MKREVVTINGNGIITVSIETKMSIAEIANLFGIYYQTAKKCIRDIEKSGIAGGDYSQNCVCDGLKVYPDYYGLEMIIALAFRLQSARAEIFRKWVILMVTKGDPPRIMLLPLQNEMLN